MTTVSLVFIRSDLEEQVADSQWSNRNEGRRSNLTEALECVNS